MEIYIISFIINSLFIFGLYKITDEDMILEGVGIWLTETLGSYWSKPVINCPPCMASLWGIFGYLLMSNYLVVCWYLLPVWCICLSGFNYLVSEIVLNKD